MGSGSMEQRGVRNHFQHHRRFYIAVALGILVWVASAGYAMSLRTLIAGDVFFAAYLAAIATLLSHSNHAAFRDRASRGDEGLAVIAITTVAAVALSLASIFALLNHHGGTSAVRFALSIASIPLGWIVLHTVCAFHYAHVYYGRSTDIENPGLRFPGGEDPRAWDFLYYSFVIGMTAQVSDVNILTSGMRRLTLLHAVTSFFFNTVILAVAVNTVVLLAP
jgi:uncharacterized membrane protein